MKELLVPPNDIRTSRHVIDNFERLNFYYSQIKSGNSRVIRPVTLMKPEQYPFEQFISRIRLNDHFYEEDVLRAERLCDRLEAYFRMGGEYLLCDGNHRCLAFALNGLDILSRQIETSEDLHLINQEFEIDTKAIGVSGPWIMRESTSLDDYFFKLYTGVSSALYFLTIDKKLEDLTRCDELFFEGEDLVYKPEEPPF